MADNTINADFQLPQDLAEQYKSVAPQGIISFSIPKDTPLDKREELANNMYQQWYMNQTGQIPTEQTPNIEKTGILPAMYAGLKKGGSDILGGIQQIGLEAQKTNPLISQQSNIINSPINQQISQLAKSQAQKQAEYEKVRAERPIAAPIGEMIPSIALRNPLAIGSLEALKYGDIGERGIRGVLGATGAGIGNIVAGKLGSYFNPELSQSTLSAYKSAQDLGINPRLSELTGSRDLSKLEDVVMQSPAGGSLLKAQQKNQNAYNRATAQSIGINADNLSEDVLSQARNNISNVYNTVKSLPVDASPIRFTKSIEDAADSILRKASVGSKMKQPNVVDPVLLNMATSWKDMAKKGDFFSGDEYAITRENLSNLAWDAEGSAKIDYRNLLNALDDAAEQSLKETGQKDLANQLKTARNQYANLKTIEKGNVIENGNVDIKKLRNAVKLGKESAYKEGNLTGNLATLSKYSEATSPIKEGSQTAGRGFYQTLLNNPVTEIPMAGVNALFSKILASPMMSYVPSKLAGTDTGKVIERTIQHGAKIPFTQAEQDLIYRRLYNKQQGNQ